MHKNDGKLAKIRKKLPKNQNLRKKSKIRKKMPKNQTLQKKIKNSKKNKNLGDLNSSDISLKYIKFFRCSEIFKISFAHYLAGDQN